MTDNQTPPDWVLIEAAKRSGGQLPIEQLSTEYQREDGTVFRALCDMIERYEQPPVDRKVLCAREAMAERCYPIDADDFRAGTSDENRSVVVAIRAIELWEEGFGK